MPLSTVLNPTPLTYEQRAFYPRGDVGTAINDSAQATAVVDWHPRDLGADLPVFISGVSSGGDNVGPVFEQRGGRLMAFVRNTASTFATGWSLPTWNPLFDPAAGNGGAVLDPTSVVLILDYWLYYQSGAFTYPTADATGIWFQARKPSQPNMFVGTPNGGGPDGGFGVAVNDDGGGNGVFEFVSYEDVNILQRTNLAALAPTLTECNRFRFIITSAIPGGGNATLSLEVNGTPVPAVTALEFDDVTLFRPNVYANRATGMLWGSVFNASGGPGYWQKWHAYVGRFTPDGREIMPI